MSEKSPSYINYADFVFKNRPIKIIANRNSPKVELAGLTVGPFEEGNEYEVMFWVAQELEKVGVARRREETLTPSRLYKIQWTERIQAVSSLSSLPENFYPRLRRLIVELKRSSRSSPEKMREFEYALKLSKDIIGCRLKKVVSLASTPGQKGQVLRNLTVEELALYERLDRIIGEWRAEIL